MAITISTLASATAMTAVAMFILVIISIATCKADGDNEAILFRIVLCQALLIFILTCYCLNIGAIIHKEKESMVADRIDCDNNRRLALLYAEREHTTGTTILNTIEPRSNTTVRTPP